MTIGVTANPLAGQRIEHNPLDENQVTSLRKTLGSPCSFRAKNCSLRTATESLSKVYSMHVWIDPNVDLDRRFDFDSKGGDVASTLDELAAFCDASIVWLGAIIAIVPDASRDAIETAFWKLYDRWPKDSAKTKEFSWHEATSPSQILSDWGKANRWKILGLESVQFDLWRGGNLPAGPTAAQLSCLVSGLNREVEIDVGSGSITLKEMAEAKPIRFPYAQNRIDRKLLDAWSAKWPQSRWVLRDEKVWIEAFPIAHRQLVAPPIRSKPNSSKTQDPLANQRFTFDYNGRLITVLESLAAQAHLTFSPWPVERSLADTRVSVRFVQASIDSILDELSKQTGCQFKRTALEVQIESK